MDSISDGIFPDNCYALVDPEQLASERFQVNLKSTYEEWRGLVDSSDSDYLYDYYESSLKIGWGAIENVNFYNNRNEYIGITVTSERTLLNIAN